MSFSNNKEQQQLTAFPSRRWGFLPILDYYIFSQFMIPFTVLILAFIILFMIGDIFNDLQDFMQAKAQFSTVARFFILKLPGNIRFILPICMLLACMYTMANFGKNMEITAMRASGVSLLRCGGSIYIVGLIVTGVNFWFNEQLVPDCEREAEVLKKKVTHGDSFDMYNMLTFRSPDKYRTWLFKYFAVDGAQKNVILKKYRDDGRMDWDLQAEESRFEPGKGWYFKNLVKTPYGNDGFMPESPVKMDQLFISVKEIPETPDQIMNAVKEPEELSSVEILQMLRQTKDMAQKCKNLYETILYCRIAFPWSCFLAVFLGIPLAASSARRGIFISIITAVGVIIVYQLTSNMFMVLGKQGYLPPFVAGLAPIVAFILYGWFNVKRQVYG